MISHRCKHVLKGLKLSTSLTWEDHTSIFPEDTRWLSWKMPEYSLLLAVVSIKSLIWFRICCKKLCFLVCFHSFHFFDSFWMLGLWVLSKILRSHSDFHYLEVADKDSFETFGCSRNPSPGIPVSTFGWGKPKSRSGFGWASFGGWGNHATKTTKTRCLNMEAARARVKLPCFSAVVLMKNWF